MTIRVFGGSLWKRAVVLMGLATCAAGIAPAMSAQNATTGEVKAAFLYNFARFTEWPPDAFDDAAAPFVIGVAGDEVLRQTVEQLTRGKAIGGRALKTRHVKETKDVSGLQILFIGATSAPRASELVKEAGARPILTVGDVESFCEKGGMIAFQIEQNRVRFEVQIDATESARLKVSSRVLTLAKAIHGRN